MRYFSTFKNLFYDRVYLNSVATRARQQDKRFRSPRSEVELSGKTQSTQNTFRSVTCK